MDLEALRKEFADYCEELEPGIRAKASARMSQFEVLMVIAMTLFACLEEAKKMLKDRQATELTDDFKDRFGEAALNYRMATTSGASKAYEELLKVLDSL